MTGPAHGIPWAWWATRWQLQTSGAKPVRLTPRRGYRFEHLSGFVIGGGNDIDPAIYGGDLSASRSVDPARDEFELGILSLADRLAVPVLGICRGAQLINVHQGGTLLSDLAVLRRHTSNRGTLLPRKPIRIDAGSVLADFLGGTEIRVNSLHHQAVELTGKQLVVTARDRDDIVQGIESAQGVLRLGIQWHPEYLPQHAAQRRLFRRFVVACR